MSVISISNLSFSYTDKPVLKGINLEVEEGEFVGIIGPNGSGKTTLLRLLLDLETPDEGTIKVFGQSESYQDRIGYVPQRYERDPNFPATVRELLYAADPSDLSESDVLDRLQLSDLLDSRFVELSGGQQQRVMVAFAMLKQPDLLILDEPSLGVDIQAQEEFYNLLLDLRDHRDLTILLVSHDLGVVSDKTDKIVLINREVCCVGDTESLPQLLETAYGEDFKALKHLHPHD